MSEGFPCSLDISKLQFSSVFCHQKPGSRLDPDWIRFLLKRWIRIRIQGIRIDSSDFLCSTPGTARYTSSSSPSISSSASSSQSSPSFLRWQYRHIFNYLLLCPAVFGLSLSVNSTRFTTFSTVWYIIEILYSDWFLPRFKRGDVNVDLTEVWGANGWCAVICRYMNIN